MGQLRHKKKSKLGKKDLNIIQIFTKKFYIAELIREFDMNVIIGFNLIEMKNLRNI